MRGLTHVMETDMKLEFTNVSGTTKAVKTGGGFDVLRPNESKVIEGDFKDSYLATLDAAGVKSDDAPKAKRKRKAKAPKSETQVVENVEMTEEITSTPDAVDTTDATDTNA